MRTSRRDFLKGTAGAIVGISVVSSPEEAEEENKPLDHTLGLFELGDAPTLEEHLYGVNQIDPHPVLTHPVHLEVERFEAYVTTTPVINCDDTSGVVDSWYIADGDNILFWGDLMQTIELGQVAELSVTDIKIKVE